MHIVLAISRQPAMLTEIKKAAANAAADCHVDHLLPTFLYIGYFPKNFPACIFIDGFGLTARAAAGFHRQARIKYPRVPIVIGYPHTWELPDIPPSETDIFLPYQTAADVAPELERIICRAVTPDTDIPPDKFFPMEAGQAFLTELTTPETVFPIRFRYASTFTQYQFFVCLYEDTKKTSMAQTNFSQLYEQLLALHPDSLAWQVRPHVFAAVFYDSTEELTEFINFRNHLLGQAARYHCNTGKDSALHMQAGCIHSGLMGLNKSYYEAAETAYINRLYKKCTSFEEISSLSTQLVKPLKIIELERRIRNDMEYRNGENLVQYVRLWFQEYKLLDYSMENIQMDLLNLYASIKYVIFDMYTLREPRIKRGWEAYEIFKLASVEALEEWFCTWVCYTLNNVHSKQDSQQMRIHDALSFIENHLMEDISLDTVANYFFLNPSYFSTLFKKEMNETFISYVTRMKMEKAAELLKSERSVSEVAALLGYDDLRHFRNLFKKHYKMLPNAYKKMYP